MNKLTTLFAISLFALAANAKQEGTWIDGKIIGSQFSYDYTTGTQSTTVNTIEDAFDNNVNTFFAASESSFGWVGLEFDKPYVITTITYMPSNDAKGPERMLLGVFEGANNEDFSDALPIYMIKDIPQTGTVTNVDVSCSKGFKYVRYVGPHDARCNIAELAFYGYASVGDDYNMYQPTNLPLVVVNTPGMEWFNEADKEYAMEGSHVYIIDNGTIDTDYTAQIRGRGHASWEFPKKPFRIKFDKKQNVLDAPATAKKWVMVNNYGDKTLMRNMLAFDISRAVGMDYTPYCRPVDLIFNGQYEGTYQLCDQIDVNPDRVNITEMKPEDTSGEALTGGYLIEIDAHAFDEDPSRWFLSLGGHIFPVKITSPDNGVEEQYNYIRNEFSNMERAVFNYDPTDMVNGYTSRLDQDSFLRHLIVNEVAGNTDTYWSVYMTLDRGADKFKTGPCWDFDLGFDNDNRTYPINKLPDLACYAGGASYANGNLRFFVKLIVSSQPGALRLKQLWSDARLNRNLNAEYLDAKVMEYYNLLHESQELNFKRWPIMNTQVHKNPVIWGSYEAEVQAVRDYLAARFDKLDELIGIDFDGIDDATSSIVDVKVIGSQINITGTDEYHIYNTQGIEICSGYGACTHTVTPGIYIVRAGESATKIIVNN